MTMAKGRSSAAELIAGECLGGRMRILNRAVTALYDEALRPHGLRVGQMTLLAAVAQTGTEKPANLCRILSMEKSTLSRDVELMKRNGWLEVDEGSGDRRARPLKVTSEGMAILESVVPAWRRAQERAAELLGAEASAAVRRAVDGIWKDAGASPFGGPDAHP
jgi:DNA-binding MarR family transcriptional regulator